MTGCTNQIVIDTNITNGDPNVTGCFVLMVGLPFLQSGVKVDVAGSNFPPAGGDSQLIGSSTNFDLNVVGLPCEPPDPVPTVSQWGLLILLLSGMSMGTVLFGRRRAVPT
ncbi:MAG: hypothetical protein HOP29_10645 [Phycisphaerales bacterium]|nr:hypothetical protein [Phycisphaerales bacterium]